MKDDAKDKKKIIIALCIVIILTAGAQVNDFHAISANFFINFLNAISRATHPRSVK